MISRCPAAIVFLLTLGAFSSVTAQQEQQEQEGEPRSFIRRYLDNVIGESGDPAAPKFIHYPTLSFSPETNWEFGVSSLFVYSANRDLTNRLSELKAFTFYTLENQYGLTLEHALYTDRNKWFFYGATRFQSFPMFYYGVGRESPSEVQAVIDGQYTTIRERILRETWPSVYMGLELNFQGLRRTEYLNTAAGFTPPEVGRNGSNNFGLGFGVLYDNIHNAMNPREGLYSEWAFLSYGSELGSDFSFTSWITDNRVYVPVGEHNILAAQLYGEFTAGNPPFNMLALMGGSSLMRGYYRGRYRDRNLVAGQVEFRILPFPFSKRFGASVFLATGQVYGDDHAFSWQHFLPTGGAGGRFLLFPDKDIYTRLDLALTREGRGYYFSIGEAF